MSIKNSYEILKPNLHYHIYNRAVGSDLLFREESDYFNFIERWKKYVSPLATVYAYCLMPNHFHFMVRIMSDALIMKELKLSDPTLITTRITQKFSNLYSGYSLWYNRKYSRKGKLFMLPFKRKSINDDFYYTRIIYYIHRNPIHHGLVDHIGDWKFSSYNSLIDQRSSLVDRTTVHSWFGDRDYFIYCHQLVENEWYEYRPST
jgi:REP element-mobilizing transposase RayT